MNIVLQLTYDPQSSQDIAGAFIRGNSPAAWFHEINNWNIPLNKLICLIIPAHTASITPAGLFVVFNDQIPDAAVLSHPYTAIGSKLFIPVHASLHPVLSNDELNDLLIWEWQVFHPGIGFVGFNKEDQQEPVSLLSFAPPLNTNWEHAHPGLPPMAKLHEISIDNGEEYTLLNQLKEEMNVQPLSDIPGVTKPPGGLMGFLWKITGLFSKRDSNKPSRKDLEESRNRELERLMKLFDEDTDEALRYAIPLASNYANRGTAAPGGRLGTRDTNFNLNKLGGGERVDAWNVDRYKESLTEKYYAAAQKAEAKGDFKKAAYIYANLLGNFTAAARVLEMGQFYREAAVIYKEHLNKPLEAAQCLEKGGLLLEAIELYKELERYEKTGDLYVLLTQTEKAKPWFRKSVDVAHLQLDYQKAALILKNKLHLPEEALASLLTGWNAGMNQTECLEMYFNMMEETQLSEQLLTVFEQHTPVNKQSSFLGVLVGVYNKTNHPEAKEAAIELAYKIISQNALLGNTEKMHLLKHFLPEDEQLVTDFNLYKNSLGNIAPKVKNEIINNQIKIKLHEDVNWMGSATYNKQMLIFGQDNNTLYLVRIDKGGYQEHYAWQYYPYEEYPPQGEEQQQVYPFFPEYALSRRGNLDGSRIQISLRTLDGPISLKNKVLPANRYFNRELAIHVENELPEDTVAFWFTDSPAEVSLHTLSASPDKSKLFFNTFYLNEQPTASFECTLNGEPLDAKHITMQPLIQGIVGYYFHMNQSFYECDDAGKCKHLFLGTDIFSMIMLPESDPYNRIIARTKKGSILIDTFEFETVGDYFADNMLAVAKVYIPGELYIIASEYEAEVYDLSGKGTPVKVQTIHSLHPIREIISTGEKNECFILDNKGVLTFHYVYTP
jgi:hypothetical protein